jgi:RimJ/RimL family protein N-acetyltransferase
MLDAAKYLADERLRTGHRVVIRSLRPEDRADVVAAVNRTSAQSLYRRFFGLKRHFSEKEIDFFLKIDFTNHVALVAIVREVGRRAIVGGARYVAVGPGTAEVAFTVVDKYQGQGIGGLLMRHLATIARDAGLRELTAEVLPENTPMIRVFEKSGLDLTTTQEAGVVHAVLKLF